MEYRQKRKWTESARDCYKIGCDCNKCYLPRLYPELDCKMKEEVAWLLEKYGEPPEKKCRPSPIAITGNRSKTNLANCARWSLQEVEICMNMRFSGKTYREIGEKLGRTVNAVAGKIYHETYRSMK